MTAIEFDMFENTGHEDMSFGFTSVEETLDRIEGCEETIPEFFDDDILKKEEPIPFQNKICHTKERVSSQKARPETDSITESSVCTLNYIRQLNAEKMTDTDIPQRVKEEKVENIDLFYSGVKSKRVTVTRNSFNKQFKPRKTSKTLKIRVEDIPGYHRMLQQAQAVLEDINELRREADIPEWTMKTLLTTNIESVDDFLFVRFSKRSSAKHWDAHEVKGAEVQYEENSSEYRFFYIPETEGNDFDKTIQSIVRDCKVIDVVSLAKKVYKLPETISFATKGLTTNLTSTYNKIHYCFKDSYLYITFPWLEGIKFSSVNYDREFFRIA